MSQCFYIKTLFVYSDKKLASRVISPPSYAAPSSDAVRQPSHSPSRSPSPAEEASDKIQFITSFGGDDDEKPREWYHRTLTVAEG